jgi:hypothetical protein
MPLRQRLRHLELNVTIIFSELNDHRILPSTSFTSPLNSSAPDLVVDVLLR